MGAKYEGGSIYASSDGTVESIINGTRYEILGALPDGLTAAQSDGRLVISGTPTQGGRYSIIIKARAEHNTILFGQIRYALEVIPPISEELSSPGSSNTGGNKYPLIGGGGFTLIPGGDGSVKIDAPFDNFTGVTVGGQTLQLGTQVIATRGSTVLTFTKEYLSTLKDGTHHAVAYFTDGRCEFDFETPLTATTSAASVADVPATGGRTQAAGLSLALLLASLIGAGAALRKKRRAE